MKIEHLAIWVENIDPMKEFYKKYFHTKPNELYYNQKKNFRSYFLEFNEGARLELMNIPELRANSQTFMQPAAGIAHIAFSLGSKESVDKLTELLRADGFEVIGNPRLTGDGYYESTIHDPENNIIELTI